jgi:hypothetical protein
LNDLETNGLISKYLYNKVKVFINGAWIGMTENPLELYSMLKDKKYKGIINIYTSIVFDYKMMEIRVCNDSGRLTRPLLKVKNNNILITNKIMNQLNNDAISWDELLINSVSHDSIIEYIDPEEQSYALIATNPNELLLKSKELSNIYKFTHCEIHPSTMFGILASCIPFPENNQSPRNTYQCLDIHENVLLSNGFKIPIKDIKIGDEVVSFHPKTFQLSNTKVIHHYIRQTNKLIYKIITMTGREIVATEDHKFMTPSGWSEVQNMRIENTKIGILPYQQLMLNDTKSIIQNTEAEKSYASFKEHFTSKYTKSLFYRKIIPQEEFNKSNSEKLFEKYYFCTEAITLLQLASIKYNSNAMIALDNKKKQEAFDDGLKSYFLDSSMRNETTLKYHLFNALGNSNYNDKYDVDKLVFLCRLNNRRDAEVNNEFIISEYKTLLNTVLIKNGDADNFEKYHKFLVQNIDVLSLKQEIEFKYHIEIARIGLNQWKEKKIELYHVKSAFNIKPDDKDIKSIVTETLNISISENRDSETVLKLVDEFSTAFPFLKKSTSVLRIKAHCLLDLAYKNFNNGLIKEGEDFIAKNEDLCKENNLSLDTEIVERGYLSVAKYYYNAGNRIKAKEYLNKGLKFAPESIKIKDKLQIVN